jgi:hypothetical protein
MKKVAKEVLKNEFKLGYILKVKGNKSLVKFENSTSWCLTANLLEVETNKN